MKNKLPILFFLILLVLSVGLTEKQLQERKVRVTFGVRIGIEPTTQLTDYALIYFRDKKIVYTESISLKKLIKIGEAEWPLPNSNVFFHYFDTFAVHDDTLPNGDIIGYHTAFDSIWKLQFPVYPYKNRTESGWANGEIRPSLKQQKYIYDRYGSRAYDKEYIADTAFFQLLNDVRNPQWIEYYKSLR